MRWTFTHWAITVAVLTLIGALTHYPAAWIIGAAVGAATYAVALTDDRVRRWWQ